MIFVTPVICVMSRAFAIPEVQLVSAIPGISGTQETFSTSADSETLKAPVALATLTI